MIFYYIPPSPNPLYAIKDKTTLSAVNALLSYYLGKLDLDYHGNGYIFMKSVLYKYCNVSSRSHQNIIRLAVYTFV